MNNYLDLFSSFPTVFLSSLDPICTVILRNTKPKLPLCICECHVHSFKHLWIQSVYMDNSGISAQLFTSNLCSSLLAHRVSDTFYWPLQSSEWPAETSRSYFQFSESTSTLTRSSFSDLCGLLGLWRSIAGLT